MDRFLARHQVPIIEGPRCTFLYRGEADEVFLIHRIFGLPNRPPLRRLRGTDLWHLVLDLPEGSRVEYQLEVVRGGQSERFNDPLNPNLAHSPVGSSSVCYAAGYQIPDWTVPDPDARPGSLVDMVVPSRALRRDARVTLYLPARFRRTARYPLLIVHDGGDYLNYAAAKTVLDNLIHRLDVAEIVAAFVYPGDRLAEYANSAAHARYLTAELLPRLEAELPLARQPSGRCLMGASFGAVASLATAYRYPEAYGSLLVQSGSFVFTDIGHDHGGGPPFEPVVRFINRYRGRPAADRRPDVHQLRHLRAADRAEPVHGPGVRGRRDGRPLRRGARRAQLGELARPAAGRPVLDLPRSAEVLLRVTAKGPPAMTDDLRVSERWFSDRLQQHVTVTRWGLFGRPVLVFPSAGGDAGEIERHGLVDACGPLLADGRIKLYSVDSVAGQAMVSKAGSVEHRLWLLNQFHEFIRWEVVPAIHADLGGQPIDIITTGASIGAFNAVATLCRYPDAFGAAIGMSGTYRINRFYDEAWSQDLYFSAPLQFLPGLEGPQLDRLRQRWIILASGEGKWEDVGESWRLADVLGAKGVPNRVDNWGPGWDHEWPTWRRMLPQYLNELVP